MKNLLFPIVLILSALPLSACGGPSSQAASAANPQAMLSGSQAETTRAQSEPPAGELPQAGNTTLSLNESLLALLYSSNADVKQAREGDCYAQITGRGTACVSYFDPYLDVQMIPPDWEPAAAWREEYIAGHHEENPFVDELPVLELTLMDEIDPLTPAVEGQDSLRQLFLTDERITYPFLCDNLHQTPELAHSEEVCYLMPSPQTLPSGNDPGQPIKGGGWRAVFLVGDAQITVHFIQSSEGLVAYYAVLSKQ